MVGCSANLMYFLSVMRDRSAHTIWSRHVSIAAICVRVEPIFPLNIASLKKDIKIAPISTTFWTTFLKVVLIGASSISSEKSLIYRGNFKVAKI